MSRASRRALIRSKGRRQVYREFRRDAAKVIELREAGHSEEAIAASLYLSVAFVRKALALAGGEGGG